MLMSSTAIVVRMLVDRLQLDTPHGRATLGILDRTGAPYSDQLRLTERYTRTAADTITLRHSARSREGFARGALKAAQWIAGKQGFYEFSDILFSGKK